MTAAALHCVPMLTCGTNHIPTKIVPSFKNEADVSYITALIVGQALPFAR
jgi:hypothetical protein